MIDELSDRDALAAGERDYMLVLADLIERYEDEHQPIPDVSGAAMLRHLIEAKRVTQAQVAAETGLAESTISEILRGKRGLGTKHITTLARYFHVSPAVFIPS